MYTVYSTIRRKAVKRDCSNKSCIPRQMPKSGLPAAASAFTISSSPLLRSFSVHEGGAVMVAIVDYGVGNLFSLRSSLDTAA